MIQIMHQDRFEALSSRKASNRDGEHVPWLLGETLGPGACQAATSEEAATSPNDASKQYPRVHA